MRASLLLVALVSLVLALAAQGRADWPPPPDLRRESYSDRQYWPNDPGYGYPEGGEGGEWNLWSFIPEETLDEIRPDEIALGAGSHIDRAWAVTIGDPRVVIAVLDSGIRWNEYDLVEKFYLNVGELPFPQDAAGEDAGSHDANGDGVASMADWQGDPRVGDWNADGTKDPRDLIRAFSDGVDDDGNGYLDDVSGWDFFRNDNDPWDDTDFGHGTGEARDSTSATNNGAGGAGVCPLCRPLMVRVADSFVADANDFARGVAFSVDSGASVVQEALGAVNMSSLAQQAIDYAYDNGVVIVASAADENSRHHNMPGTADHTLYVHAIVHDGSEAQSSTTFLNFNNCTNYGGQLVLSTPGGGCSSEATGITSGIAGLLYAQALAVLLDPPLTGEEVKQLLVSTVDDVNVPESVPGHPFYDDSKYPSHPGWDQRFGYGRPNTRRAVDWVAAGRIPPSVHIESPEWFEVLYADQTPDVTVVARATARAPYDWTLEWAPGIEPESRSWTTLASAAGAVGPQDLAHAWNAADLHIDNPGEIENRFAITVRLRAVAHYGEATSGPDGEIIPGDVWGEHRKVFYVHRDGRLLDAFPIRVGASLESSPKLADLDGDGDRDIVIGDSSGRVHAFDAAGSPLPGWPVRVENLAGLGIGGDLLGARGYATGAVDADARASVSATVAIADLDGDGALEVVAATLDGGIWAWHDDGSRVPGWPVILPRITSDQTDPNHVLDEGIFASPVLEDLDADGDLEILVAAFDSYLYVFDHSSEIHPGFPVQIHAPAAAGQDELFNRIFTTPTVADFDGDGAFDILVGSNEELRGGQAGAAFLVYADGNDHLGGWPFHPNWPVVQTSLDLLPMVGEGLVSAGAAIDHDHDGDWEAVMVGTASPLISLISGTQDNPPYGAPTYEFEFDSTNYGSLSNAAFEPPLFNAFTSAAFGDLDQDGWADLVHGGSSFTLALNLAGGNVAAPFEHLLGAWSTKDGRARGLGDPLPGFPQQVRDYQFFMNPAVADVSGDGYPEAIVGTGGYYLEGFDALGRTPADWPLFTGQWIIASPAVGDLDGDGSLEIVTGTRSGFLHAWHTDGCVGDSCPNGQSVVAWESYHHDLRNTGNYDAPLDQGVLFRDDLAPLEGPHFDAGAGDAGPGDAGAAPGGRTVGGGCQCDAGGSEPMPWTSLPAAIALACIFLRRRRSHAIPAPTDANGKDCAQI